METSTVVRARTEAFVSTAPSSIHWPLDPDLTFLNHGSYGVCPRPVIEAQARYRMQIERDPVSWFVRDQEPLLDAARDALGRLINCRGSDVAWTSNATLAIATVLRSIDWREGDEILCCDQEYMSAINEIRRLETREGVSLVVAPLAFPIGGEDEVVDRIMSRVSGRTRLAIISQITSPSAIIMPVHRLTRELRARGIEVLIDGAHAPGQIEVDLAALDPTYYVATMHKWVCAPKGAGMLYVHPEKRATVRPLALSSRAHEERPWRDLYLRDFDYHGTDDYTPHICVREAIEFMGGLLPGGFEELRRRNHDLVIEARGLICSTLGLTPPLPESMCPMMATIQLPSMPESLRGKRCTFADPIQDRLVSAHRIQVPIWTNSLTGQRFCRISAQVYNKIEQYERLAEALKMELTREAAM